MVEEADRVLEKLSPKNLTYRRITPSANDDGFRNGVNIWLGNICIAFCVDFKDKDEQLKNVSIELDIYDSNNQIITKTFEIIGFKIVGETNNQLIIEPIGDEQKIVKTDWKINDTEDKKSSLFNQEKTEYHLPNIKEGKKYLLSLKEDDLLKSSDLIKEFNESIKKHDNPFMENKKSLFGTGCITGNEQSCCGCCYW